MSNTEIILAVLGSSALTTFISKVFDIIREKNHRNKIDKLLLLDAVKRQGQEVIDDGEITMKDLECFQTYYDCYKELGGDGFADAIKNKVLALPIVNE